MEVSSRRLARVLHRHLVERGLLSFLSLLGAFLLHVIKRNELQSNEATEHSNISGSSLYLPERGAILYLPKSAPINAVE